MHSNDLNKSTFGTDDTHTKLWGHALRQLSASPREQKSKIYQKWLIFAIFVGGMGVGVEPSMPPFVSLITIGLVRIAIALFILRESQILLFENFNNLCLKQ